MVLIPQIGAVLNFNIFRALENTKCKDKTDSQILSSQGIREHICDILEGGREAFKKREQKYGFRR